MGEIETILDRIMACGIDAEAIASARGEQLSRRLLEMRVVYNDQSARLLRAVQEDGRLKRNPEVAAELQAQIGQMRAQMARMQAKWRMHEIEANPAAYLAEIKELNIKNRAMRDWAKAALAPLR